MVSLIFLVTLVYQILTFLLNNPPSLLQSTPEMNHFFTASFTTPNTIHHIISANSTPAEKLNIFLYSILNENRRFNRLQFIPGIE